MYLLCIKRLKDEALTIVTDLGDAAPIGARAASSELLNNSNNAMGRRMEQVCAWAGWGGSETAAGSCTCRCLQASVLLCIVQ